MTTRNPAEHRPPVADALGDQLVRWSASLCTVVVTAIAAVISYGHARDLVTRYGVTGWTAAAMPLTIDGLVATCSLVIVDCARHGRRAPWHAWALLVTGACATVAANVAAGISHGIVGALIAGWPALVACGCFELLIRQRKTSRAGTAAEGSKTAEDAGTDPAVSEARRIYAGVLAAGRSPSIRDIKRDLHVGSGRASSIRTALSPAGPVVPEAA
jgi:Protein of unknown function (DUF2637)